MLTAGSARDNVAGAKVGDCRRRASARRHGVVTSLRECAVIHDRIVDSFKSIDELPERDAIKSVLRGRLIAELFGDGDGVAATLEPDFELVMHSGATTTRLRADVVTAGVRAQHAAGTLLWTEFDDLVLGHRIVGGTGTLCNLALADRRLTTTPVGVFLRFTDERMSSEVAYLGGDSTSTVIAADDVPSIEDLHAQLQPRGNAS
jgi:hypothetical protein